MWQTGVTSCGPAWGNCRASKREKNLLASASVHEMSYLRRKELKSHIPQHHSLPRTFASGNDTIELHDDIKKYRIIITIYAPLDLAMAFPLFARSFSLALLLVGEKTRLDPRDNFTLQLPTARCRSQTENFLHNFLTAFTFFT